jgi:Carbohydrate esterase, sialic acid-specific acetylesterase
MKFHEMIISQRWFGLAGLIMGSAVGLSTVAVADRVSIVPRHSLPRPDGSQVDLKKPVQVFILMGQSNMFGMGDVSPVEKKGTLEFLTKKEKRYPHLLDDTGAWTTRNDVRYVQIMQNRGKMQTVHDEWLTVKGKTLGPEVQFGHIMGHVLAEPVLILKSCIGNRSLGWDLLPPGSERYTVGGKTYAGYKDTPDSWVEGQPKKEVDWYAGKQYDDDVANAKKVLREIGGHYPGAERYQIAGFVWWQGHKDQNSVHAARYELNLVNLIKSLRKDFNAPKAPFLLATGCGNPGREGFGLQIAEAQLAMNHTAKYPEFDGNVKCVDTRPLWPVAAESPNAKQDFHYYKNAGTYMEVGDALGWAMAALLKKGT